MKQRRRGLLLLTCAGALLTSTGAFAGIRDSQPLIIDDVNQSAIGSLGNAYNSQSTSELIGCGSGGTWGSCLVIDSTGKSRSCVTTDPALVSQIRSVNSDSTLYFGWDASGKCTFITVQSYSSGQPKSR